MTEFKWEIPVFLQKYISWKKYSYGEVISPECEIEDLIKGKITEKEMLKFIVKEDKLYDFPKMNVCSTDLDDVLFGKLYSVKFE